MTSPAVAVLLATYNGAACLGEQLDSYAAQTHRPALILVSDDGSKDETCAIVRRFSDEHPELVVELVAGPCRGVSANFLSLLSQTPDWVDIVALSDQDDVWLPDKLARGVQALCDGDGLRLYCGRTWECNVDLGHRRKSRAPVRPTGFRHALVQNVAGGNTMMLNRSALDLVQGAASEQRKVVVHDWWLYQIISGGGGTVIYDREPVLLYRQHDKNLIGANRGWRAKLFRVRKMLSGRFRRWNTINIKALSASGHRLTAENRALLEVFAKGRNASLWQRLRMLRRTGVYRQGPLGQMSLYAAALLGRL